jgi:hypothetical protein
VKCLNFFQFNWDLHRLNFDESDYICIAWRSWPGENNGQEASIRRCTQWDLFEANYLFFHVNFQMMHHLSLCLIPRPMIAPLRQSQILLQQHLLPRRFRGHHHHLQWSRGTKSLPVQQGNQG